MGGEWRRKGRGTGERENELRERNVGSPRNEKEEKGEKKAERAKKESGERARKEGGEKEGGKSNLGSPRQSRDRRTWTVLLSLHTHAHTHTHKRTHARAHANARARAHGGVGLIVQSGQRPICGSIQYTAWSTPRATLGKGIG